MEDRQVDLDADGAPFSIFHKTGILCATAINRLPLLAVTSRPIIYRADQPFASEMALTYKRGTTEDAEGARRASQTLWQAAQSAWLQ